MQILAKIMNLKCLDGAFMAVLEIKFTESSIFLLIYFKIKSWKLAVWIPRSVQRRHRFKITVKTASM